MNLHPDSHAPFYDRRFIIERNLQSIREILPLAQELGVGLMVENLPGSFNSPGQLAELLDSIPELGLHLDIGHANLLTPHNTTRDLLAVRPQASARAPARQQRGKRRSAPPIGSRHHGRPPTAPCLAGGGV